MENNIIEKIKRMMKIEGYNQKDLSTKLNISEVNISRYLSGNRKLSVEFLAGVSNLFNISLDWLVK